MLAHQLTRENFCVSHKEIQRGKIMPLVAWVDYHFGGRPDGEVSFIFDSMVQCTGVTMSEDHGYSDFFAQFSVDELFSMWQEGLAHA